MHAFHCETKKQIQALTCRDGQFSLKFPSFVSCLECLSISFQIVSPVVCIDMYLLQKKEIILNYSNNCYLCIFKIVYIYGTEVNRGNATARSRRHNYASSCLCCISPLTTVGGPVDGQTSPEIPKENTMVFVYLNCSQKFKHHWQRIVFVPFQMLPIRDVRFRCSRLPSLFFIGGPLVYLISYVAAAF